MRSCAESLDFDSAEFWVHACAAFSCSPANRWEGTSAAGLDAALGYAYDPIGNRLETWKGIEGQGSGKSVLAEYLPNALNQYTDITLDPGQASETVQYPTYDFNGNRTNWVADGKTFEAKYDDDNRLVELEIVGVHRYTFTYGPLGRCLLTEEEDLSGGSTDFLRSTHHLYEGTLPIADFVVPADASPETLRTYTRGPDLRRGSLSAAGGTAGILALATGEPGSTTATYGYVYDGNGNVLGLFDNTGSFAVTYEYDPFGNVTVLGGDETLNPFRFSTQRYLPEANLHQYLFRFYDPEAGRWLNRDPIGEEGGLNLYGFVGNEPVGRWDVWGWASSGEILQLLENLERAQTKFCRCQRVLKFLECVEKKVFEDVVDGELREKLAGLSQAAEVNRRIWGGLEDGSAASEFVQKVFEFEVADMESLRTLKGSSKVVESVSKYLGLYSDLYAPVSEGDALKALLTMGNFLEPTSALGSGYFTYLSDGYSVARDRMDNLRLSEGTFGFSGKLAVLFKGTPKNNCSLVRDILMQPIRSGYLNCEKILLR